MLPVSQWRKMHYITQDVRAVLNMQAHQYSHWEDRVGQKECVYVCAREAVVLYRHSRGMWEIWKNQHTHKQKRSTLQFQLKDIFKAEAAELQSFIYLFFLVAK